MAYADYAYYTGTYLGNAIAEAAFPRLALRASERVDEVTFGRAERHFAAGEHQEAIQKATCAIAEVLQQAERGNGLLGEAGTNARLQTEITGQHHMTYFATVDTASTIGRAAIEQAVQQAARQYLIPTGMLFAGVSR